MNLNTILNTEKTLYRMTLHMDYLSGRARTLTVHLLPTHSSSPLDMLLSCIFTDRLAPARISLEKNSFRHNFLFCFFWQGGWLSKQLLQQKTDRLNCCYQCIQLQPQSQAALLISAALPYWPGVTKQSNHTWKNTEKT